MDIIALQFFLQFLAAAVKLIAGIVLSAGSLYVGMRMLDRMTSGIEEWKEIKKGNLAVGIFYASVLISIIMLISPRIEDFLFFMDSSLPLKALLLTGLNFLLSLPLSLLIIWLAVHIVDRLTTDVNEFAELKKGNVSMSIVFSVSVLLIAFVSIAPMEQLFMLIKTLESVLL